jgi:hypothetical protein
MTQPYPLYDELVQRVALRAEKNIDIKRVCTTINTISQTMSPEATNEHYREIAALVLHYDILNNNSGVVFSSVPYDGKIMAGGKGILYSIMNFPPNLQQIIGQYIEDHADIKN